MPVWIDHQTTPRLGYCKNSTRFGQDVGLAALQSANNSVAEARSAMNQRMQCANECPWAAS